MADAVDEYEAAQATPQSKAPMPMVYQDEVPTEPATSPRSQVIEVPVRPTYIEELRLPSREHGPHPEPERFVTRWVVQGWIYSRGMGSLPSQVSPSIQQ